MRGFTPAPAKEMNGPYFAGTLDQFKVFVSPALNAGFGNGKSEFFVGYNGDTMEASAAVYAPYMPELQRAA